MQRVLLYSALFALALPLAGCLSDDNPYLDFEPGTGYSPTGKTVEIRMWVEDMVKADIFPGFKANLWAFCAEPSNPNDLYSAAAIEHREPTGIVQRLQTDGTFRLDEDATNKCSVPGPQLRVHQGDKVIVNFRNDHFHPHTIHWHGQFVPWESDGVPGSTQDAVVPPPDGPGAFTYEFEAKRAGTLWYHCHVDTQFHVMQGLYGVIIVEPQDTTFEPEVDKEYSLVFSNLIREQVEFIPLRPGEVFDPHAKHKHGGKCGPSGFPECQNPAIDANEVDVFMINGVSAPNTFARDDTLMTINPGEKIKIRMLNAGPFTVETVHLHGHDMLITHKDGNPIPPEARLWVDTLMIGPGERYDVVVEGVAGREGIWVMHTHTVSHVTNDGQYPGGMLTKLVYESVLAENGGVVTPYDVVELPGGQSPRFPVVLPEDYVDSGLAPMEIGIDPLLPASATWTFPVELPCAVEGITLRATVRATNPIFDLLSSVNAVLLYPDGTEVLGSSATIASDPTAPTTQASYTFTIEDGKAPGPTDDPQTKALVRDLQQGNYTLSLAGTSLDAIVYPTVLVDYYPTLRDADNAASLYKRDRCGIIGDDVLAANGF